MKSDAIRILTALVGVTILVSFFLPWIVLNDGRTPLSGLHLVLGEELGLPTRICLAMVPFGGAILSIAALINSSATQIVSFLLGLMISGIVFYHFFKVFYLVFSEYIGLGLWIVIISATISLVLAMTNKKE